jgi:hypothetical protein
MVIPAMDIIDDRLDDNSHDEDLHLSIRHAVKLGKKVLNKYYSKTDLSKAYRIAMVLHPTHKLVYFKKAGWEKAWIKTAEELVREEFKDHYAGPDNSDEDAPVDSDAMVPSKKVHSSLLSFAPNPLTIAQPSQNMFDTLIAKPTISGDEDEFTDYLQTKTEQVDNPIAWWIGQRGQYPRLSRMAIDYLTIPGIFPLPTLHCC